MNAISKTTSRPAGALSEKDSFSGSPLVDTVGVAERAARFQTRSIKADSKIAGLKLALSMIDHTTLEGMDTPGKVRQLCAKAVQPDAGNPDLPHVAAVCVYPTMVNVAAKAVKGTGVQVASVATAFPSGMTDLKTRLEEVRYAVDAGADEIDMVISRGKYLAGEYEAVSDEIAAVKEACGQAHLKVIIEAGELGSLDNVRHNSDIAMRAGADFIKTSTGKISGAATLENVTVMMQAIADFYEDTGKMVGMKPAGGIKTAKLALHYLVAVKEILGAAWLTPEWFRFGASSLTNDICMQLRKQASGAYQSKDYFSND
jgi:deoxyribose-phosphate aldolase